MWLSAAPLDVHWLNEMHLKNNICRIGSKSTLQSPATLHLLTLLSLECAIQLGYRCPFQSFAGSQSVIGGLERTLLSLECAIQLGYRCPFQSFAGSQSVMGGLERMLPLSVKTPIYIYIYQWKYY